MISRQRVDNGSALGSALSWPRMAVAVANSPAAGGSIRRLTVRCARILRKDGPAALLCYMRTVLLLRLHTKVFDRRCVSAEPASVSLTTQVDDLTIASEHRADAVEYAPTPHLVIGWIQNLLPEDVENWSFVDVGAGRGRAVMAAASFPYRLVLGIELAAELQRDALRHIASMPAETRMANKVDVINADAATFEIPDGPSVLYLFNPFGKRMLRKFLANVIASHRNQPRRMVVAYYNPVHAGVMTEFHQVAKCELPLKTRMKFATLSPFGFELYEICGEGTGFPQSSRNRS